MGGITVSSAAGVQRWQPVMVGVTALIVFLTVSYTYLPPIAQDAIGEPNIAQTPAGQLDEDELLQRARAGIEQSLHAELIARHSGTDVDESFFDPMASSAWRTNQKRFINDPTHVWSTTWIDVRISTIELLQPDLALVRFVIILPLCEMEVGRAYREDNGWWYWTEPPVELWGEEHVLETEHLRFEYRERDAQQVESMVDWLETLYVDLHQSLDIPVGASVDSNSYFVNQKFTFQLALDLPQETVYMKRRGPIYSFSSPAFTRLGFSEQTSKERYTTLLATVLGSGVVQKMHDEAPENLLSPLVEGRMYRWDGEQWLRTSPTAFPGEATRTIETEHFRMTFQEADTAAVVQAAPELEHAYQRLLSLLQLHENRPAESYRYYEEHKFNIEVKAEDVRNWSPAVTVIPVTAPAFQSLAKEMRESDVLVYTILSNLLGSLMNEVGGGQPSSNWGILTAGYSQWLLDESVPVSFWHGTIYEQNEIERVLALYYPVRITELIASTDGVDSFPINRLLLDYIVKAYGEQSVARYIRALGEYDDWDALTQAIFNVDGATFEAEWNQYLVKQYPDLAGE